MHGTVDYIRQSREDKRSTPERQRDTCEGYAKSQGWLISKEYADIGWRRSEDETRPAWQALLADASKRLFDVLLVEEQSRAAATDHYAWSGYMAHFRKVRRPSHRGPHWEGPQPLRHRPERDHHYGHRQRAQHPGAGG